MSIKSNVARVKGVGSGRGGGATSAPSKTAMFGGTGRTADSASRALSSGTPTPSGGYPSEQAEAGLALTTPFAVAATNVLTRAAHGFAAGDQVRFSAMTGGAGIVPGQRYWVLAAGLTANDFKVSAAPGGAELDITSDATVGTVARWLLRRIPGASGAAQSHIPAGRRAKAGKPGA